MHTSLDPIALFQQAGSVVQGVILLLCALSVWCWAITLTAMFGLASIKRTARGDRASQAYAALVRAGESEARQRFAGEALADRRGRVQGAMQRAAQQYVESCQRGTANLAIIASVAPFIGLFGTVWGIMTSFIGIAAAKDTSLAVVAPGIAEALGATAIGLFAAIPAAFLYNRFAASFGLAARMLYRRIDDAVPAVTHSADATEPPLREVA